MNISIDLESIYHLQGNIADYYPQDVIFNLLTFFDDKKIKATFYVVGDYAELFPVLIREISYRGHEIGSHSKTHCNLAKADNKRIFDELFISKKQLEDISGRVVSKFRAPEFKIPSNTDFFYDSLIASGYRYDSSSIIKRNKNDFSSGVYKNKLYIAGIVPVLQFANIAILPGGKYSRVIPWRILNLMSKDIDELYFHLHDLDEMVGIQKIKKYQESLISRYTARNSIKYMESFF